MVEYREMDEPGKIIPEKMENWKHLHFRHTKQYIYFSRIRCLFCLDKLYSINLTNFIVLKVMFGKLVV